MMFEFEKGKLKCEELVLRQLTEEIKAKYNDFTTPFYVYSQKQIELNINRYKKVSLFNYLSFVLSNFACVCAAKRTSSLT